MLGVLGAATAACSPYELQTQQRRPARPTPTRAEAPAVDPDVALATGIVAAERALLEQIDATVRRHPRLERVLAATREVHDAHVTLLEDAVPPEEEASDEETAASSSPSSEGSSPAEEASRPRPVPRDRARALRAVAGAEDELALTAKQAAFAARSGAFARVLASIAAAAAQQSAVLRTSRAGGGRP